MDYKIQPWAHQLEAIERARELPNFALFFEPGAGKSSTVINILRHKFNAERRLLRTIIFAPPIVLQNWRNEWSVFSSIDPASVTVLAGTGRRRLELFTGGGYATHSGEPKRVGRVFITNYESLLMPDLFEAFKLWAPEALVFDESHKLKNHQAKRSKLAAQLAAAEYKQDRKTKQRTMIRPAPLYKYILSGSPVLKSPMDLFQQFLCMDGGATFGDNFFTFRAKFFRDKNAGMDKQRYFPDWQIMPGALEEINRLIFQRGVRKTKAECMDLPPLIRQEIKVGMLPEQKRMYDEMKKDFVTYMGDAACTATMAMTKALRLMQIASGYVKTEDGKERSFGTTPKMDALEELLEELTPHSKVLVWAVWKENYEQIRSICEKLKIGFVEVHGEISPKKKDEAVDQFKNDDKIRVFLGHPGSGGIGINLVNAPYSIFYSRTFSLEHSLQAEARNHRGGAEIHEKITRYDLISEGTIEELIVKALASKIDLSDKLLSNITEQINQQG